MKDSGAPLFGKLELMPMAQLPPMRTINKKTFEALCAERDEEGVAHRIHFASSHDKALKRTPDGKSYGKIGFPFRKGVEEFFPLKLYDSNWNGCWRGLSEGEYVLVDNWVKAQTTKVFLSDGLSLSVALDLNRYGPDTNRTPLGQAEFEAKANGSRGSVNLIKGFLAAAITSLPYYQRADFVAGVPAPSSKPFHLPSVLADEVSRGIGVSNCSSGFIFEGEKKALKGLELSARWSAWEAAKLRYDGVSIEGKDIVLIDDKYQSGCTMHYVAMTLQQAGAARVYGLSVVKTLRDTDNTF
jgi:hypothetical protein